MDCVDLAQDRDSWCICKCGNENLFSIRQGGCLD